MRLVITRVTDAAVRVGGELRAQIARGLLVLVGVTHGDGPAVAERAAEKILRVKVFDQIKQGESQPWRLSVTEAKLEILVVSQFTLYADVKKKNKPDFHRAMGPVEARKVYGLLLEHLRKKYEAGMVQEGEFGAMMAVSSTNDGPVTLLYTAGEEEETGG